MVHENVPKISIIIPAYNYARFLPRAVESVIAQSFRDFEIIIVDDGSTDDTAAVAQGYLSDPRVRYIHQKNRGLSAARNIGIKEAKGEFIALLDADDLWLPSKLEKQIPMLEKDDDVALVYCMAEFIDKDGKTLRNVSWPDPENKSFRDLLYCNWIVGSGSSVLIKKSVFQEVGFFDESLKALEDLNMWLRILRNHKSAHVNEALVRIRKHRESMQGDIKKMEQNLLLHIHRSIRMFPELKESEKEAFFHAYEGLMFLSYTYRKKKEILQYYLKAGRYKPSFYYESIMRFIKYKVGVLSGKTSDGKTPD